MSKETWQVLTPNKVGEKTYWNRIGAAWKRDDGGFSLKLNALPLNGELLIAPPREQDDRAPQRSRDDSRASYDTKVRDDEVPF